MEWSLCAWRALWGIDCPGCGFLHSLVALALGHFEESVLFHPLGIPVVVWLLNLGWLKKIEWSARGQQAIGLSLLVGLFVPWIFKLMI